MHYKFVYAAYAWLAALSLTAINRVTDAPGKHSSTDNDRGDVPGWVMITVMTAIVVLALLTVFRTQVTEAVENAFDSVRNAE